jgi:hypothetical protein
LLFMERWRPLRRFHVGVLAAAARRKSGDNYYLANDANFVNRYYHRSDILLRSFFR